MFCSGCCDSLFFYCQGQERPRISTYSDLPRGSQRNGEKVSVILYDFSPPPPSIHSSCSSTFLDRQSLDNINFFRFTHPLLAIAILLGMATTGLFAFDSPEMIYSNPILSALKSFSYGVFQSQRVIQYVFYAASLTHLMEACVALKVSSELKCSQQKQIFWFLQTILYGYGSLGMLYERRHWLKSQLEKGE